MKRLAREKEGSYIRELPGNQQGDAWFEHKSGRISASKINDLMNYLKNGTEGAKRRNYRFQLLAERLTHRVQNNYVSQAMEWGIEQESHAKQAYEMATGEMIIPVGFVLHPTFDFAGASPDGLLSDAIIEVKCPESTTFLEWRFEDGVPEEHIYQMQWQMACTELKRGVFVAYDPRQPESIRYFVRELQRDDELIAKIEAEAQKMNAEVEAMIAALGLPPTVWNTNGDEVIHTPREYTQAEMDDYSSRAYDFLDSQEIVP